MSKYSILFLILAIGVTSCAPAVSAPQASPTPEHLSTVSASPQLPTPIPTLAPAKTSSIPLADSLLLTRYIADKQINVLTAVDPANGYPLAAVTPISLEANYYYAVSPDRKTLAVVIYKSGLFPSSPQLYLINLTDWSFRSIDLANLNQLVAAMSYSPDGSQLAIAGSNRKSKLLVVDTVQGTLSTQKEMDTSIRILRFTTSGKALMIYGVPLEQYSEVTNGAPVVRLLNSSDLNELWNKELSGLRDGTYRKEGTKGDLHQPGNAYRFTPALVFAPGQDILYVANPEKDEIIDINFSARTVQTREIRPQMGWVERLLAMTAGIAHAKTMDGTEKWGSISPDGQFLYIVGMHSEFTQKQNGQWELKQTPLNLQIIRTADAVETGKFDSNTTDPVVSADGKYVYLRTWNPELNYAYPSTDVFDVSKGQVVAHIDRVYLSPTHLLNGQLALVSGFSSGNGPTYLSVLAPDGSESISSWSQSDYAAWIIIP